MFGDAWWLDTDGEAFQQRPGGSVTGSEAWQSRRPASVVSTAHSVASGLTGVTEDHRCGTCLRLCARPAFVVSNRPPPPPPLP